MTNIKGFTNKFFSLDIKASEYAYTIGKGEKTVVCSKDKNG